MLYFLKLIKLLLPFASHYLPPNCDVSIIIFDSCRLKIIFYTNYLVCQGIQFGENLARQYFIFKLMLVIGYNNQFTVVQRQNICKLFVKDNWKKLLGINPLGLIEPWADYLEIIALKPVKTFLEINLMGLIDPYYESLVIIALQPVKTQWAVVLLGKLSWEYILGSIKQELLGIKPMGLSAPWAKYLDLIALLPV